MRKIRHITKLLFIALAVSLLLSGCGGDVANDTEAADVGQTADEQQSEEPGYDYGDYSDMVPFMWLVTSPAGQTMYMFGSIHYATPDLYPLPPVVMDAFARSDYLATEIWEPDPAAFNIFVFADGRTFTDFVSEDLHVRMMNAMRQYRDYLPLSIEYEFIDFMGIFHPFMWMTILQSMAVEVSSLYSEYGLEEVFWDKATARNMPIIAIEDVFELNAMMANMSPALYEVLLESALDITTVAYGFDFLYSIWRSGDYDMMLDIMSASFEAFEDETLLAEWETVMLTVRDIQMADRASEFMADGKKVFFVVGAAHLIGEGSVIDLLAQRGYQVERIK